jgi:hypothetical protein
VQTALGQSAEEIVAIQGKDAHIAELQEKLKAKDEVELPQTLEPRISLQAERFQDAAPGAITAAIAAHKAE